jgi:hypothetical protein
MTNHGSIHPIAAVLALLAAGDAPGQHSGDIFLDVRGGAIVTGAVLPGGQIESPVRAFAGEFGDSGTPNFTSNPGFDCFPGTFAPGTRIGFNILDQLTVWNGGGFEPTGGETLRISFLTLNVTTGTGPMPGFDLAVQSDGGFHRHLSFTLNSDGSGNTDPGIYLLALELYSTDPEVAASQPFWIAFNDLDTAASHDAALAWVEENLVAPLCDGDINNDDEVDVTDLLALLGAWGPNPGHPADLDDSGTVNVSDLLTLLGAWGPCI